VHASGAADRIVFKLQYRGSERVGQRTYIAQDRCPEAPTRVPPSAEATAEGGEAEGDG
jgi:hypothetical protein